MKSLYLYIGGAAAAVITSAILAWFIFASSPAQNTAPSASTTYGSLSNNATNATFGSMGGGGGSTRTSGAAGATITQQKVFKISDGPVAGATFVQTLYPTTTLARFVMADNGHAYDLALDVQGAVPKPLSNTTIPGVVHAQWARGSAVLQYLDGSTPKTVYLGLPSPSATSTSAARLAFFPDGITSYALAPDGSGVAYLLRTSSGAAGYAASLDGSKAKQLFSLPLRQVELRWPAAGSLLAYSAAAAGVPGIAFVIDAKSGVTTPLLTAAGLTATADLSFRHVLYQTSTGDGRASYDHDVGTGGESALSFSPNPEQCVQSPLSVSVLLCAVPLAYVPNNFVDLWHQGTASAADSLIVYDLSRGTSSILATPGSAQDGGVGTDMAQLAVSPDGHYALFVSKIDRSLWGVRLTP
jgi:hypothetical protein